MLRLKLLLLIGLSAAGQGLVRLPQPRLDDKAEAAAEKNARVRQLQRLQAELEEVQAERNELQLREERLEAERVQAEAATKRAQTILQEKIDEIEQQREEFIKLLEENKKLQERYWPFGPGDFEPQWPPAIFKRPAPPQIDDMRRWGRWRSWIAAIMVSGAGALRDFRSSFSRAFPESHRAAASDS